jgi:AcrR family transcriptional regulator
MMCKERSGMSEARRSSWAGTPPADEAEARRRIMDAAVRCVQRFGVDKTSIADIAQDAGVTRPTVYSYFGGRERVLHAAMLHAARDLSERLAEHVRRCREPRQQIVENLLFCLREFGRYPSLALLLGPGAADLNATSTISPQGMEIARRGLAPTLEICAELRDQEEEIAEVLVRFFLSLLTLRGPTRNEEQLRAFLQRRLVPCVFGDRPGPKSPIPSPKSARRGATSSKRP